MKKITEEGNFLGVNFISPVDVKVLEDLGTIFNVSRIAVCFYISNEKPGICDPTVSVLGYPMERIKEEIGRRNYDAAISAKVIHIGHITSTNSNYYGREIFKQFLLDSASCLIPNTSDLVDSKIHSVIDFQNRKILFHKTVSCEYLADDFDRGLLDEDEYEDEPSYEFEDGDTYTTEITLNPSSLAYIGDLVNIGWNPFGAVAACKSDIHRVATAIRGNLKTITKKFIL